jgi:secreted trypsin-like serine protease
MSKWLTKATVQKISLEECTTNYTTALKSKFDQRFPDGIPSTRLCARNKQTNANTCQGDSGSGAFVNADRSSKSFVVGITSYGLSCASDLPSFYTRVQKYLDWIEPIVWPEKV